MAAVGREVSEYPFRSYDRDGGDEYGQLMNSQSKGTVHFKLRKRALVSNMGICTVFDPNPIITA